MPTANSFDKVETVILGGGQGTRLFPLTLERSKPAISFGGKYRLIDIPISNSINSGIRKIFVLTQYLSAGLHRHITRTYRLDNFSDGFVEILAAEQTLTQIEWFQGTADAVRRNLRYLLRNPVDHILILAGDQMYRMDFRELLATHIRNNADITLGATMIPDHDVPRMGILKPDVHGRIHEVVEKPESPEEIERMASEGDVLDRFRSNYVTSRHIGSMGIYVFKREALLELLDDASMQSFAHEIVPWAVPRYRVFAHPFEGYWVDVGTISSYFEANLELTDPSPRLNLYQGSTPIFSRHRSLPAAKLMKCNVDQAIIGEGSILDGATLNRAIIGLRSAICAGTTIKNSIILGNDFMDEELDQGIYRSEIGPHATIENAIIDKNVTVGEGARLIGSSEMADCNEESYYVRDGLIVIPQGTEIPPGTEITV
ncbi:MAG: glucose-1-phosphate adenylyltransferase [Gemmatimonadetes bacterium]|nr:glucose-1-phosphate adenylyltransferase [Gemmatimonadota bacterium]